MLPVESQGSLAEIRPGGRHIALGCKAAHPARLCWGTAVKLSALATCTVLCLSLAAPGAGAQTTTRETPPPDDVEQGDESEPMDAPLDEEVVSQESAAEPAEQDTDAAAPPETEPENEDAAAPEADEEFERASG